MNSKNSFRRKRRNSNRSKGSTRTCSRRGGLEITRKIEMDAEEVEVDTTTKEREMIALIGDTKRWREVEAEVETEESIEETVKGIDLGLLIKKEDILKKNPGKK